MGDTVQVRLSRVDLTQRQIDFELVDAAAAATRGTVRAPAQGGGAEPGRGAEPAAAREPKRRWAARRGRPRGGRG
jgi:hypothetical protein